MHEVYFTLATTNLINMCKHNLMLRVNTDWEYPGYEPHGGSPRDRNNFSKLLLTVREALNAYQSRTGDAPNGGGAFGLTAALP